MYLRYGNIACEADSISGPALGAPRATGMEQDAPPRAQLAKALPAVPLLGVAFHAVTERQCIDHILDELDARRGGTVVTPNLDILRRCTRDVRFSALVAESNLVIADGMPLVWASRIQGTPLPQRVAGSNLISSLSAAAANRNRSVFLLGGSPGTAESAARILQERSPTLRVVGTHCPPMGFETDEAKLDEIIQMIIRAGPDIVFVALGSPKQELLVDRIRGVLPHAWWLGVGASFSFLCGEVKRAPRWMQHSGLEWVHRLFQEPKRLFKRYIVAGIPFAVTLLGSAAWAGAKARVLRRPIIVKSVARPASTGSRPGGRTRRKRPAPHETGSAHNGYAQNEPNGRSPNALNSATLSSTTSYSGSLARLKGLILLGGTMRPTPLIGLTGRSILDLPVDGRETILNHWLQHAADVARHFKLDQLPVRIMVNGTSPEPISGAPHYYGTFRVERDVSSYRGTGGLLGDLAADYDDDDLILVANAAQILLDPLTAIAAAIEKKKGEVCLISHQDGTPSNIMLLPCKALRLIQPTGYVDMKEQALPTIASHFDIKVIQRRRGTGLPVRSLADYIVALRQYHGHRKGSSDFQDPLAEHWQPTFAMVEDGAVVDPKAHVHDSVVLRGARIEAGAVVLRSMVCPDGVVKRDVTVADQLVASEEMMRNWKS